MISHSGTWLVEVLFYQVLLPWLIGKFRLWNNVEKDKSKKVNLINTITNFSRISREPFLWSIEYPVHRQLSSTWQPKNRVDYLFSDQIWKYETEEICLKCFSWLSFKCSKKGVISCFFQRAPCKQTSLAIRKCRIPFLIKFRTFFDQI